MNIDTRLYRYGTPTILQFVLDGSPAIRLLPVNDIMMCGGVGSGCVFTVGMRSNGASGGRYFFTGHISQLHLFPTSAVRDVFSLEISFGSKFSTVHLWA